LVTGCENHEKELAALTFQKDSLVSVSNAKDQSIEEFFTSFEEIETNLSTITAKQNLIAEKTGDNKEVGKDVRQQINAQIAAIGQLMDETKAKTEELSRKLKNSNFKLAKFEKMVASLNTQIADKDTQLVVLNDRLVALNTEVTNLNTTVASLNTKDSVNTEVISAQTKKMNTGYIAVGDYEKLRDEHVVTKEGGFLGLGKEEKLSANLNQEAFKPIDITQLSNIPVGTKEAKLVTVHPVGSYSIEMQNDKVSEIRITDASKFWSTSKYLVVMTDN
jgi:chromosome segregation ATPase